MTIQAWPFLEAEKILKRIKGKTPSKGYVLFETGYGPSGLPHIGTFGEVVRTTMVRNAFKQLAPEIPTRLFCISDDMDGLRKVPENMPNQEMLTQHLGRPLISIPDPFGTSESFGANMNKRLCGFLDNFGFEYEFYSSAENYKKGIYDKTLLKILENYDKVMKVMLPTLGADRQKTYSPFLPLSPKTGRVLQVAIIDKNLEKGTIIFEDEDGTKCEVPVTGGHCKLQWKPDLGMRWAALDVDFEMYGKDHLASAELYDAICRIAGGTPPEQFMFELFLDKNGEKISKSKGNGFSLEEWIRYAPKESLSYYMYQNPRKAKKLYFEIVPKAFDEYLSFLGNFTKQPEEERFNNPVWHVHNGNPPKPESPISFALLLNLTSACHAEDPEVLWGFIKRYEPSSSPENSPHLDEMVKHAIAYYHDHIKPLKKYRAPTDIEKIALLNLVSELEKTPNDASAEDLQTLLFNVGKNNGFENLKDWFSTLYETLLGQSQGPRFGSFIKLYGKNETTLLIKQILSQ